MSNTQNEQESQESIEQPQQTERPKPKERDYAMERQRRSNLAYLNSLRRNRRRSWR
jgi:hypothetical protein